jgi:hypothetical protein
MGIRHQVGNTRGRKPCKIGIRDSGLLQSECYKNSVLLLGVKLCALCIALVIIRGIKRTRTQFEK